MKLLKLLKLFKFLGIEFISSEDATFFRNINPSFLLLNVLTEEQIKKVLPHLIFSESQLAQDLLSIAFGSGNGQGFFVEFGATNGINMSNSYILEKRLGWDGIVAEPSKTWHKELKKNRACNISFDCVSSSTGKTVEFLEVKESNGIGPTLSSQKAFANNGDWASTKRMSNSIEYLVKTISLNDLLGKYNAPEIIDLLSIDTEGSEFSILQKVDFEKYKFKLICVEHNYIKKNRKKINKLLTLKGYKKVFEQISKWDDWYIFNS